MGRIIDYVLDTALAAADTLVIDNATDGTRKTTLDVLADYILATHVNSSITKNVVAALAECVKTSAIVNNLTTTAAGSVLDARQGKVLKDSVDELNSNSVPLKLLSKANSRNYTLHLPSNGRYLIFTVPNGASDMTAVLATVYASGAVFINNISGSTSTTFTTGTNTLTASSTNTLTFSVLVVALERSVGVSGVTIS